eukprot:751837-Hanusia_phi.AAC.3
MIEEDQKRKLLEDEIMSRYVEGMLHNSKDHLEEAEGCYKAAYQLAKDLYQEAEDSVRFYEEAWKSARDKLQQEQLTRAKSEAKQSEDLKKNLRDVPSSTSYHPTGEERNQARRASMQVAMSRRRSVLETMTERRKNKARIIIQKMLNSTLHFALQEWREVTKNKSKENKTESGDLTEKDLNDKGLSNGMDDKILEKRFGLVKMTMGDLRRRVLASKQRYEAMNERGNVSSYTNTDFLEDMHLFPINTLIRMSGEAKRSAEVRKSMRACRDS